ncbi:MAG: DUF3795 domain-containing protein [Patescibacteria group bacterium]
MPPKICAACGLDCAQCGAYLAHKNNDDTLREKTAREWNKQFAAVGANFKPAEINCVGCLEKDGAHSGYCCKCPLRKCALTRAVENCAKCADFAECETRRNFEKQTKMDIAKNCIF